MIDLKKISKNIDEAFAKETPASLTKWLKEHQKKQTVRKKRTRKERILSLIYQRQSMLSYEHEREYLATMIDNMVEKEVKRLEKKLKQ